MKKISEKLFEKLKNLSLYPVDLPKRTRAGKNLLAGGCFKWNCVGQYNWIESYYTMSECVKAKHLSTSIDEHNDIIVWTENE